MCKSKNHSKYSLIHLLIDYDVKVSVLQIVRRLKQEITFIMNLILKNILKKQTFLSDGYFACSIGEGASYDTIRKYVRSQG